MNEPSRDLSQISRNIPLTCRIVRNNTCFKNRDLLTMTRGQLPVFVKFYWSTDMPICLCFVYGLFCPTKPELSNCSRQYMAHKTPIIYCLALYKKWLPTPDLDLRWHYRLENSTLKTIYCPSHQIPNLYTVKQLKAIYFTFITDCLWS